MSIHKDVEKGQVWDAENSPFQKAEEAEKRIKMLLWADSGAGKTTAALNFPGSAIIDMEGGSGLYVDKFCFHILNATTADEVMKAVRWLLENKHQFRTLIIDPITVHWEALQKKWSDIFKKRNKGSKGFKHEFYDLQPKDWLTIKAELKELIRMLTALDMNVIVTARQKVQYADGAFMRAIGETFDGEKSLPYMFDTVLRLFKDEKGRFMAENLKDRTGKLPKGVFENSHHVFEESFGLEILTREAKPIKYAGEAQKTKINEYIILFQMTPDQVQQRLAAYGAESLDELTEDNARIIIEKLGAARNKA